MSPLVDDGSNDIGFRVPLSWCKWTLAKHGTFLLIFAAVVAGLTSAFDDGFFVRTYAAAIPIALVMLIPSGLISRQYVLMRNGSIRIGSWRKFAHRWPTHLVRSVKVAETRRATIIDVPANLLAVRCLRMEIAFYDGTSADLIGDVTPVVRAGMAELGAKLSHALGHRDDRRMMTTETLWLIHNLSRSYGECLRHAVPQSDWILQPRNDSDTGGDIALAIRDRRVDIGYHSATFPVWDIVALVRQILTGDGCPVSITETFDVRVAELYMGFRRRGF